MVHWSMVIFKANRLLYIFLASFVSTRNISIRTSKEFYQQPGAFGEAARHENLPEICNVRTGTGQVSQLSPQVCNFDE